MTERKIKLAQGKFSGILLASDLDGTLLSNEAIPKRNSDAIKYFTENGGYFTVATGRTQATIAPFFHILGANAPLLMCNGMQIYDSQKDEYVFQDFMPSYAFSLFEYIVNAFPTEVFVISSRGKVYDVSAEKEGFLRVDDVRHLAEYMNKFVSILPSVEFAKGVEKAAEDFIKENKLDGVGTMYSWPTHLEFVKTCVDKGNALSRLARHLNVEWKNVFAIGDYMNDIPMLEAAHISFAPQNAIEQAKKAATHIVCSCDDGAVADAIEAIEKML